MTDFPFTLARPVAHPGPLPEAAEMVIIGGGIIGVMTALFLARAGHRPLLLEKGRVAAEQSSRNWGWIRQQGRDPAELPIMIEARRQWQSLGQQCGDAISLRETGVSYLARTEQEMTEFAEFATLAAEHGLTSRVLDRAETAAMFPAMTGRYLGALHTPSDMRAEPWTTVPAVARLAVEDGARIVEGCAVRGLDIAAGRIAGVVTEAGSVRTDRVLVAGGAWSSLLLRRHGVIIPQLSVRATAAATGPLPEVHAGAATDEHVAFRRRADGGYTLAAGGRHHVMVGPDALRHVAKYIPALRADPTGPGLRPFAPRGFPDAWGTPRNWSFDAPTPFEAIRILNPAPEQRALRLMRDRFEALFPQLGPVPIARSWAGMIDAMPDVVPIVDGVAAIPGLFIGTGMSAHGFGIGPGMGRVLADLMTGTSPGHDLSRFRLSRFTDGSPIRPGPAL